MKDILRPVHVLDEALYAARKSEVLLLAGALVDEHDLHAVIEEGKLAQPPREDVVVVVHHAEDFARGEEMHFRPTALACARGLEGGDRNAITEFHLVHLPIAPNREAQPLRKAIDHRHADAM